MRRFLVRHLPKTRAGYRAAKAYVNWYRGENDHEVQSNGEQWLLELLLPHCRVAFDVGAHVGDWAEFTLSINPKLTLYCFEPTRRSFAELEARGLNARAVIERVALSDSDGEVDLMVFGESSPLNSIVWAEEHGLGRPERVERVKTVRFDSYFDRQGLRSVDFVKLDVEGAEMLVLRGMGSALDAGRIAAIQFEYGRPSIYGRTFLRDLFGFLTSKGFVLYKLVQNRLHHFERYNDELESFEYQNWVAVRRGSSLEPLLAANARPGLLA